MEIIAAIIGAIVVSLLTWGITKSDLGQKNTLLARQLEDSSQEVNNLSSALASSQQRVNQLSYFEQKYLSVRQHLQSSYVIKEYLQPVILVGPRAVGKTSLLMQWHAPRDHSRLNPTQSHNTSTVPIYDFKQSNVEPHFADPDIKTDVHIHLKLKVHDFPGELGAQKNIIDQAIQETGQLRANTGKSLGVVLICVFDAGQSATGLNQVTQSYYNGELFSNLRSLVAYNQVGIERLILVFNKYDLLKKQRPNQSDVALLTQCLETYKPILLLLKGVCNPEKVCEVFTVLSRDDMVTNNRGAPIVLGEAARNFVDAMAGPQAVKEVLKDKGTNLAASMF